MARKTLAELCISVENIEEKVNCLEKEIDCDTHKEAIDTLKVDNISIRNIILPKFKEEVLSQVDGKIIDIKIAVAEIKNKISKQTAFFIGGCLTTPFIILIINRYGPIFLKAIGW